MSKPSILIIDDDPNISSLLTLMLEDDFSVSSASTGNAALHALRDHSYMLVIIDMHLPDINGLEIFRFVANMPAENQPGLIALSGDSRDEMIKQAFSYGAGDYILKPFNVVAFHQRLMRYVQDLQQIEKLRRDDLAKSSVAQNAMRQAAAYGVGLELVAELNRCQTIQAFMFTVSKTFLSQGYNCAIECRYEGQRTHYDPDEKAMSENEIKVFQLLYDTGRIYSFGKRTIFNEENISILVKNMPQAGTDSYDLVIDLFAKLIPVFNERFLSIQRVQAIVGAKENLARSISLAATSVNNLKRRKEMQINAIATTIGMSFHELDMTEQQERFFLDLIEKELASDESELEFDRIIELLNQTEALLPQTNILQSNDMNTDEHNVDDIELF